ncbi:hypothetical protein A6M27_02170 [Acidithiobacillus thiooxidans]|nr:hypothetical protein [Acidithiobacillus thiooxidans]OCX69467.1 hypothetical protein A6P07_16500 [Acidithiobacillus thiooxidans]OCX78174.1 hypothetical protein A6O26_18370 [Acidithiobacillus thiooxidans]OCX79305.1 hypothetical protein A6O24_02140 [Acidithiobacillus thiooxidans]OCX86736.1 hypothetical protein A6P08_05025 [Acidithiobacillus thiooxidans]OCX89409.1 hypothetical protein A6M27_02170 [Acidithiobacillus thiooxidans]
MHQITRISGQIIAAMGLYISVCTCSAAGLVIASENPLLNPPINSTEQSIQQNDETEIQQQLQNNRNTEQSQQNQLLQNDQNAEQLQQNQLRLNQQQEQDQLQQEKERA